MLNVKLNKSLFGLQHFSFKWCLSEFNSARCMWPSSCHTLTCRCWTLKRNEQKKAVICKLQTYNVNWAFNSLVYSSCRKYVSVVQGLYTFQLLLCRTEIWFFHTSAESYIVLFSQGNAVGSRENVLYVLDTFVPPCFFLLLPLGHERHELSLVPSLTQHLFFVTALVTIHIACFIWGWV